MTPEPTKVTPNADALTAGATVLGLTRTRVNGPAPTCNRAVPGSSPGAGTPPAGDKRGAEVRAHHSTERGLWV